MSFESNISSEGQHAFPLDLTSEAASVFPEAVRLALALTADNRELEVIKQYLMRKQGISEELADSYMTAYLKFLVLVRATKEQFAPSDEADIAWHAHILHTQLYERFCQRHFGRFLHHVPSDPNTHPPDEFFEKQNRLGVLFFGEKTIYCSHHGHCVNHHACDTWGCSPAHGCVPGASCSIN